MANVSLLKGQSTKLNTVPIVDGQILITEDTGEMYLDNSANERISIGGSNVDLSDYYTKEEINTKFIDVASKEYVDNNTTLIEFIAWGADE